MNHLVQEYSSHDNGLEDNEIKRKLLKLSKRDVIEQVIFDPQLGIVKREIHYGIIDYLTVSFKSIYIIQTYPMKRRYDELMN